MNAHTKIIPIGIGHNTAPLPDMLKIHYADLLKEIAEAIAAAGRAPAVIEDDAISGKVSDLTSDIRKLKKQAEAAHDDEKAPFLDAGREVDGFFREPIASTDTAIKALLARQAVYLDLKDRAARAAAAKAEAEAREAAEIKLREAERAQDKGEFEAANDLLTEAAIVAEVAETASLTLAASTADLTRNYSVGGSVTSLRREWTGVLQDRAALVQMPDPKAMPPAIVALFPYIPQDALDKALRAYVKAGFRTLAGARIFEQPKAR